MHRVLDVFTPHTCLQVELGMEGIQLEEVAVGLGSRRGGVGCASQHQQSSDEQQSVCGHTASSHGDYYLSAMWRRLVALPEASRELSTLYGCPPEPAGG